MAGYILESLTKNGRVGQKLHVFLHISSNILSSGRVLIYFLYYDLKKNKDAIHTFLNQIDIDSNV